MDKLSSTIVAAYDLSVANLLYSAGKHAESFVDSVLGTYVPLEVAVRSPAFSSTGVWLVSFSRITSVSITEWWSCVTCRACASSLLLLALVSIMAIIATTMLAYQCMGCVCMESV